MTNPPKISVLTPAYNAAQYIRATIDSVLSQTEQDFELLIINDGSTDDTEKIVREYDSPKIIYHANPQNLGIAKTYNRAIQLARGKYLAIAESDDISHPQRFEVQARYLDEHPNIGAVSSRIHNFSSAPPPMKMLSVKKIKAVETPAQNRARILRRRPLIHHQVAMLRADVLRDNRIAYNENLSVSCDTDLFLHLAQVSDLAELNCELLGYRSHESNTTVVNKSAGYAEAEEIVSAFFNAGIVNKIDFGLYTNKVSANIASIHELNGALEEFMATKADDPLYDSKALQKRCARILFGHFLHLAKQGVAPREIYAAYRQMKLFKHLNTERKMRLLINTLRHSKNH